MSPIPLFPAISVAQRPASWMSNGRRLALGVTVGVALLLTGYLVSMYWTGQISHLRGCGGSEGCANLLGGRWGSWLLVPVSFWALLAYAGLLGLIAAGPRGWWSRTLVVCGGLLLLSAAIWFMAIQAFVERHYCLYCCILHACGVVIAVILLQTLLTRDFPGRWSALRTATALNVVAISALIVGQIWGPQPATHEVREISVAGLPGADEVELPAAKAHEDTSLPRPASTVELPVDPPAKLLPQAAPSEPPAASRTVGFMDGKIRYTVGELPLIGDPAAEHVLVKYFDYTCDSCRGMHEELEKLRRLYPRKFAVIVVPTPLNRSCNPYLLPSVPNHSYACELAQLGLAVWRANPAKFAEFHEALFRQQHRITPQQARDQALKLVGREALERAERDPWVAEMLAQSVSTYRRLGPSGPRMPKVLLGHNHLLNGVPRDTAQLVRAVAAGIQARLDIAHGEGHRAVVRSSGQLPVPANCLPADPQRMVSRKIDVPSAMWSTANAEPPGPAGRAILGLPGRFLGGVRQLEQIK